MSQMAPEEQAFVDSLKDDSIEGIPVSGTPADSTPPDAAQPETAAPETSEGTTEPPAPDSFSRTDLDALLADITDPAAKEAVTRAYKGFQGDYTRTKQELAQQREALEGLDPALAQEAVQFYTNLQQDPAFAMEVYDYLTKAFEQMGMSPQEAHEAAVQQAQQPEPAQVAQIPDPDEDPDGYTKARLDQIESRFQQLDERERQMQAKREEDELAANLMSQEMAIRSANPTIKEADIDRIYDLALSKGGSLFEAQKEIASWRNDVIQDYLAEKGAVSDRIDTPPPAAAQVAPEVPRDKRGNVDLEGVHKIALQRLLNATPED